MRIAASISMPALFGALFILMFGMTFNANAQVEYECKSSSNEVYTVTDGDALYEIGIHYGDIRFWEAIYIINADIIDNPDLIYTDQRFKIPQKIFSFSGSGQPIQSILDNPFCDRESLPIAAVDMSRLSLYDVSFFDQESNAKADSNLAKNAIDSGLLETFRQAFSSVVDEAQQTSDTLTVAPSETSGRDRIQQRSERQIMMEIDGMVLDETRSKVGRDFYDVFYTNWQQPPDTHSFSIRISEQPSPSLGTIIYVRVNDRETFRMRLQPRYDFIQQAGHYAVRQTYSYLQNNDHRLQIY